MQQRDNMMKSAKMDTSVLSKTLGTIKKCIIKLLRILFSQTNTSNHFWYVWLSLILGISGLGVSLYTLNYPIKSIKEEIRNLQPAQSTLYQYFSNIETGNLDSAWTLLSQTKKETQVNGIQGFKDWLNNFVSFEGLQIKELSEKSSPNTKVFIAEFDFKKRGMKPVHSIWGMYVKYNSTRWEIDYSSVLFEKDWKNGACEFYSGFDICKK